MFGKLKSRGRRGKAVCSSMLPAHLPLFCHFSFTRPADFFPSFSTFESTRGTAYPSALLLRPKVCHISLSLSLKISLSKCASGAISATIRTSKTKTKKQIINKQKKINLASQRVALRVALRVVCWCGESLILKNRSSVFPSSLRMAST
jgi:hypothetical protein